MKERFLGFFTLYKLAFRLNIKSVLPWVLGVVALAVSSYVAYGNVFPELADQQNLAMTIRSNPAFRLIFGVADNVTSADSFTAWRSLVLGSFLTGLMTITLVVKLTRAKEDSGEAELVSSSVVGRHTQSLVAIVMAWTASLITATAVIAGLLVSGGDAKTSITLGIAFLSSGIMFSMVAAVSAELGSHSRAATSIAISFLGMAYLLRGFADTVSGAEWASDLSPLGWIQKYSVANENVLWPAWICIGFVFVLLFAVYILNSKRDFGQGIIASRPGIDRARLAKTAPGLAMKLQRGTVIGWTAAFMLIGTTFGYMLISVSDAFSNNDGLIKFVGAEGVKNLNFAFEFARTLFSILGIIAAIYGAQIVLRLFNEEREDRIEPLLAGSLRRSKLFISHTAIAIVGSSIALFISGVALSLVSYFGDVDISVADILQQALLAIPPILLLVTIAVAAVGIFPTLRSAVWAAISISFALTILGPILELSDSILAISPFWHVPSAATPELNLIPTIITTLAALGLWVVGMIGFNRRDINKV